MAYHNEINLDEHDSSCKSDDADTIRMDSPEFQNAVDNFDLPAIPDSVRLSESTTSSTLTRYAACRDFDITCLCQDRESNARQSENGFDNNWVIVESDPLTYKAFGSLQASQKMRYFDKLTAASTSWALFEKRVPGSTSSCFSIMTTITTSLGMISVSLYRIMSNRYGV
jgi:hypothetical protein